MKVLVIIPAYNEEDSIVQTVEELISAIPDLDFVVINDGSSDHTRRICLEHKYNLLDLPANIGLTGGFQTGARYAIQHGYDAAIQFDADGQHDPRFIPRIVACMEETEADIVIGSRFVGHKKSYSMRMIGSRLISLMIRLTTGIKLSDPTSGMRLFNAKTLRIFASKNDFGPEPDSIAYLIRKGAQISEVGVNMRERAAGTSYFNIARAAEYMLRTCISILFVQWFR